MFKMTMEQFHDNDDNYVGFCIECGAEQDCCEPDARKYKCEDCGEKAVYGTSELLLMGKITIVDEDDDGDE